MWLAGRSSVITDQMFLSLTWHIEGPRSSKYRSDLPPPSLSSTAEVALLAAVTQLAAEPESVGRREYFT